MKQPTAIWRLALPIATVFCQTGLVNFCQVPMYQSAAPENAPPCWYFSLLIKPLSYLCSFNRPKTLLVGVLFSDGNVNFYIFQMKHFKFGSLTLYFHWLLYLNQNTFEAELNEVRWVRSKFAVAALTDKFLLFIPSVNRKDRYGPASLDIAHYRQSSWGSVVVRPAMFLKKE